MFQIAIEFLGGRCHAAIWDDPAEPDWPVAPARVFSAVVAALHRFDDPADVSAARSWLGWLERLPAPTIYAVKRPGDIRVPHTHSVRPVVARNPKLKAEVINPRTDLVHLPSTVLSDPVMLLRYDADLDPSDQPLVQRLLGNVSYVGSSESLVHARLCDEPPHPDHVTYLPDPGGGMRLSVPAAGRLAHLDEAFEDLQRPGRQPFEPRTLRPARLVAYGTLEAARPPAESDMGEVIPLVFLPYGGNRYGPTLDALRFQTATRAVRRAFLSRVGDGGPPELTGHDAPAVPTTCRHVAFIPLAESGYPRARSFLRGVGLVIPRGFPSHLRAQALRAFNLESVQVEGISWPVSVDIEPSLVCLKPRRYATDASLWTTMSPIVLPRYPKPRETVEDILQRAALQAGLPVPVEVIHSPFPFTEGCFPISMYRKRLLGNPYLVHAKLRFSDPVRGPILMGKHRHEGFGLFVPLEVRR